jgi:putative (di)nucleoside polyphosphate hydrolase
MSEPRPKPLRRNVCVVLTGTPEGRVLVFRRVGWRTLPNPWQFPQGGIEEGETPLEGMHRELKEEIGTDDVDVLKESPDSIVYEWPPDVVALLEQERSKLTRFRGQEQTWFLARLRRGTEGIRFDHAPPEFDAFEWVTPAEAAARVVAFKRDAYRRGLTVLGLRPD